jgi:putative tricarboxylic transport membrane protein
VKGVLQVGPPLLGLGAAVGLLILSRGLDQVARGAHLGPGFWPRLALAGLAAACLARAIAVRRPDAGPRAPAGGDDPTPEAPPAVARGLLITAIALVLLYVLATPLVGFPIATAGFVVLFMRVAGARSAPGILLSAVLGPIALSYVFVKLVYLPLPKGGRPFEDLTVALYRLLHIF